MTCGRCSGDLMVGNNWCPSCGGGTEPEMTKTRQELLDEFHRWVALTNGFDRAQAGRSLLGEAMDWIARQPEEPGDGLRCGWCGDSMDEESYTLADKVGLRTANSDPLCSINCLRGWLVSKPDQCAEIGVRGMRCTHPSGHFDDCEFAP